MYRAFQIRSDIASRALQGCFMKQLDDRDSRVLYLVDKQSTLLALTPRTPQCMQGQTLGLGL